MPTTKWKGGHPNRVLTQERSMLGSLGLLTYRFNLIALSMALCVSNSVPSLESTQHRIRWLQLHAPNRPRFYTQSPVDAEHCKVTAVSVHSECQKLRWMGLGDNGDGAGADLASDKRTFFLLRLHVQHPREGPKYTIVRSWGGQQSRACLLYQGMFVITGLVGLN